MAIEFLCGSCRRQIRVSDAVAGKRGKCPHCGVVVQVPAVSASNAGSTAPKPGASNGTTAANSMVKVACPSCQQTITAPASLVGQKGMCPHCQTVLIVGGRGNSNSSVLTPLGNSSPGYSPAGYSPSSYSTPPGAGASPPGDIFSPSSGGYDPLGGLPAYSPPQPSYQAYGPAAPAPNPFGYSPSTPAWGGTPVGNPYAAPPPSGYAGGYSGGYSSGYSRQSSSGTWAPAKLMVPAILMLIVAVLTTALRAIVIPVYIVSPPPMPNVGSEAEVVGFQVGLVMLCVLFVVVNVPVIAGSVQMVRLRSFNLARVAAILACLPCSEYCINAIFGVWVLIILHLPDVRRRFD